MKGFIIYENDLGRVNAVELRHASFCYESIEDDVRDTLRGTPVICASANCSKDDTYDFETGALIALMKMCGSDKVVKACNEAFSEDSFKTYATKYERELNELKKDFDKVKDLKDFYKKNYEDVKEHYDKLGDRNKKLLHDYNLCLNSENALKYTVESLNKSVAKLNKAIEGYKNDLYNTAKRCKELEEENEKLKLDCEKLQHGYNDMMFCGGRQNGKQYTALVDLFKKIDQKKVDAAYKEAYGSRVIWCSSQPSIKDTVDELIKQSREFTQKCVDKWLNKPLTKREEMWGKILGASKCPPVEIKVAKEDITTFLRELQDIMPEARWNGSDCSPLEYTNPYWFKHEYIYFALFRYDDKGSLRICYDENPHSWINKPVIEYLPPMRWDLFKKGRLAVKVTYENYKGFYDACERELGKKPCSMYCGDFTVSICKKDGNFEIFTVEDQKKTGRKIVDWEDVR